MDSEAKGNGLSKADLDVSAKLPEQRLERGEKAEAFPGRQVVAEDDLLQLGVTQGIEVEVARQVSRRSRPLAFSTAPFCQEAYASQNQIAMAQALASKPCRAKAVLLSKVMDARRRGSSRRKIAIMTATVSAADLPARRAASTNRVLRSLSTSTGRVRLQISRSPSQCPASGRPWTASGRSWMERRSAMVPRD